MRNIIGCMLLLSSVTSEKYTAILFHLTYSPDPHMVYTNLFVNTTSSALTNIVHGQKNIQKTGAFNFSISREFTSTSEIFRISVSETAKLVIEVRELSQFYFYSIAHLTNLGEEYILVSSSNRSSNYMCRISSNSLNDTTLDVRVPSRLRQEVSLSGSCFRNSHCILKRDKYIQIQSTIPLYQTVVASSDTLVVFCKDTSIFQVLPKNNCGKYFQVSCAMFKPSNVNVNNCTIKINTVISKKQNITINGRVFSVVDFVGFNLEKQMLLSIQAEYEVCILFVDSYYDNSGNKVIKTKMLSSMPIPSSQPNTDVTSASEQTSLFSQTNSQRTTVQKDASTKDNNNNISTTDPISRIIVKKASSATFTSLKSTVKNVFRNTLRENSTSTFLNRYSVQHSSVTSTAGSNITSSVNRNGSITRHGPPPESHTSTLKSTLLTTNQTFGRLYSTTALLTPVLTSKNICKCVCRKLNLTLSFTRSPNIKINEVIAELKINKSELSSVVRRKSCAKDDRASAQGIGYVGAVVIALVLATIALFDLINLFEKCIQRKERLKKGRKKGNSSRKTGI